MPAGLLLNNLSVFRGCDIVFDSSDVPEDALAGEAAVLPDMQVGTPTPTPFYHTGLH